MEKYCVTVAGPFEEEVYRFNSSDPKKIIKSGLNRKKHMHCVQIFRLQQEKMR